ncbi:glycosyltransferase [Lysinibacter sp. HNR]|uniref:glycosyltransferase n=1 Tax=Lysinibacter sp. HNR TaxID=3031408 RepID=UPI00243521BD|nr:glycosyltransferase [Lysinibacter sp. HNR]WGD38080.1 glycosyltransferase [Lysinibacter sp. HNR]
MPKWHKDVVSVVLINYKGVDDTIEAISNLQNIDWPEELLEIIVVENASGDGSEERLRSEVSGIKLVVTEENLGFAGGCNLGVKQSTGEFVAFLNNDARPDSGWIREAIAVFKRSSKIGAVASKVLDWEGEKVDFISAGLTWYGMGYKPLTGDPAPRVPDKTANVLFGTGAAMFVRREVYDELGGFDERYFMFFEDVDLGWRLNLAGYRFVYEPSSLAYHKHHASMNKHGSFKETYLLERNALFTLYKNIGEEVLHEQLGAAFALAARRAVARGELDSTSFDLRKGGNDDAVEEVSRTTLATLYGIDQFVEELPSIQKSRQEIQANRVVDDRVIWKLFGETDVQAFPGKHFSKGYNNIVSAFDVLDGPTTQNVLVIAGDPIGAKMAGPAIRAWNIAEALSVSNEVTLVSLAGVRDVEADFKVVHVEPGDERSMKALEKEADVIVFQGLAMALFKCIRETDKILVCDIYDPMHLEHLEQGREHGNAEWTRQVASATDVLNEQLERGDFFLCASERQRHFYLGQMAALGRINPDNYKDDPDLKRLISVVPFGLDREPPVHRRDVLKGVLPGIAKDDKLLLWSGGLYNWFDPETLIRAVADLSSRKENVRLFFQGTKHPHPGVPEMSIVEESRSLATQLGVLDKNIFFNSSWVEYAERQNYLMEADAGVSTHFAHVETTFSFRTRILDYLWAELPMVVTEGDHFAELVSSYELGVVVRSESVSELSEALEKVLFDDEFIAKARSNVRKVREKYFWGNVLEPLVAFVDDAKPAEDRISNGHAVMSATKGGNRHTRRRKRGLWRDLELVVFYLKNGGPRVLASKVKARLSNRTAIKVKTKTIKK